jgi:hypothetical protein
VTPRLTIDDSAGVQDAEGMVVLVGALDEERIRVQVASEVWCLVLDHFRVGLSGGPPMPTTETYRAVEKIGHLVMKRRGVPQYGMLTISLG